MALPLRSVRSVVEPVADVRRQKGQVDVVDVGVLGVLDVVGDDLEIETLVGYKRFLLPGIMFTQNEDSLLEGIWGEIYLFHVTQQFVQLGNVSGQSVEHLLDLKKRCCNAKILIFQLKCSSSIKANFNGCIFQYRQKGPTNLHRLVLTLR